MDTTKKGDQFENQVYTAFAKQIDAGDFFAKSNCCKLFKKKGYYSKDREKDIVFDVSIEISLPGQEHYSILILIECKNYNHRVPVDDIEEFYAKIQQISGGNIKGIVVSTNAFQDGAFKFSKSKGIGLLRYFTKENLEWILTRSPSSVTSMHDKSSIIYDALHNQDYKSRYFDWYGYFDGSCTTSSKQFFSDLVQYNVSPEKEKSLVKIKQRYRTSKSSVPYKKSQEVEEKSVTVLSEIGYEEGVVPLDSICSFLSRKVSVVVERNKSLAPGILGEISFDENSIKVDDLQAETEARQRFTLAHEFGHLLLDHRKYMIRESCHDEDIQIEKPVSVGVKEIKRLEWQANYFASCLLLPSRQFIKKFFIEVTLNNLSDRGYGLIYLDNQPCNIEVFLKVTNSLMREFKVSRTVVKLRLKNLGFLNEAQIYSTKQYNELLLNRN